MAFEIVDRIGTWRLSGSDGMVYGAERSIDIPHVSHFRLAAHLLLAIFILGFILWLILDMLEIEPVSVKPALEISFWG